MKFKRFSTGLTGMVRMFARTILVSLGIMLVVIFATSVFCFGLEKANNIINRLRVENSKRHIGYTISILKSS